MGAAAGGNPIVRFGIIILFFGVAFLLRYAAEHSHLTIEDRLIAVAVGACVLLGLGWHWRNSRRVYARALLGGGVGVLYMTVFFALRPYALLSPGIAFLLLASLGALCAVLGLLLDSPAFAVLAAIGGYLAPVLAANPQGDHVLLFSYYALLNLVVVAIAWFRSWRPLNLVAFLFTYGVGAAWGVLRYRPEYLHSTEPFLILFFVMFVGIALLFALSRSSTRNFYVDGTLVFGTPAATMALQAGLVNTIPHALAHSALLLCVFYLLLAWVLHRQSGGRVPLLVESFVALSVAFATLAIALMFEDRWTGAAWALEGAAIVWIGLRQNRPLAVIAGILLQLAAAIAYFHDIDAPSVHRSGWMLANGQFVSELMLSVGALVGAARMRGEVPSWFKEWQGFIGAVLFLLGLAWWVHAGVVEIERDVARVYWPRAWLALAAGTAAALSLLGSLLRWHAPRLVALLLLPALALLATGTTQPHPFAFRGWWIWPIAGAAGYWILRRDESILAEDSRIWLHSLGLWLLSAVGSVELAWRVKQLVHGAPAWSEAAYGVVPALTLMAAVRASHGERWPCGQVRGAYGRLAPLVLGMFLLVWGLFFDVASDGYAFPMPYVPLLNPMDFSQGLAIGALIYAAMCASNLRRTINLLIALAAFGWLNAVLLRSLHHYADIPYNLESILASTLAQSSLTIFWTLLSLAAMVWANRVGRRVAWMAGAVLLCLVIVKLFMVDLSRTGSVPRIVSFLGVGVLMLIMGYIAPLPPPAAPRAD